MELPLTGPCLEMDDLGRGEEVEEVEERTCKKGKGAARKDQREGGII